MYKEFWDLFITQYRGLRSGVAVLLVSMGLAFLEVLNVGFLIPLVEVIQATDEPDKHWVTRAVSSLFDILGVPFKVWSLLVAAGLLLAFVSTIRYLRFLLVANVIMNFSVWLRAWAMRRFLNAPMAFFHAQDHAQGKLADTLTTQVTRGSHSSGIIAELIVNIAVIIAFLTTAFIVTPVLTLVTIALLALVVICVQFLINRTRTISTAMVQRELDLQAAGLENLNGINVIKSFQLENRRETTFRETSRDAAQINFKLQRIQGVTTIIHEVALFVLVGGILLAGISLLELEISVIVALLFILYRLMPRVTSLNNTRQSLLATLASLRIAKSVADSTMDAEIVSGDQPFLGLKRGIEFRDVNFSYDGSTDVLKDTNFTVESGKMTAVVGSSGAGKSTIVNLLLRYYDPVAGGLLVDGVDLKELDLDSWRTSIAVVTQDIFLFNETIASNIELGRPGASREQITEAARRAYANDFIQELPEQYETLVGDRGWNLSGGERQRVALARAILKEPKLLILDEATSSLDSESEQLIQRYMSEIQGTCTMVVIAHRMSTIQNADKIVVIEDGRVVEEGSWDGLLAGAGAFANFHRLQSITEPR